MKTKNFTADKFLDIRGVDCPITWVKTKLMLEQMNPGEILEVKLDGEEAISNVPKSAKGEGHRVIRLEKYEDIFTLLIERGI